MRCCFAISKAMSLSPLPKICTGVLGSHESDCETLIFTSDLPALPFLVVTKITPFPALEPYKEAEAASFNTCTLSILEGSKPDKGLIPPVLSDDPLVTGTPSITNNGVPSFTPFWFNELKPRIVIFDPLPPGEPERLVTSTPATRP